MASPSGNCAFRVLIVCSANQIRSPLGELLLNRRLAELGLPIEVASAGTKARDGHEMHPRARIELARRTIVADGWCSRELTVARITEADLILTATGAHRAFVITKSPEAIPRTFQLLQFARIARQIPAIQVTGSEDYGPALLASIHATRSRVQPTAPGADDLVDPITGAGRAVRRCALMIDQAVAEIVRPLAGNHELHGAAGA